MGLDGYRIERVGYRLSKSWDGTGGVGWAGYGECGARGGGDWASCVVRPPLPRPPPLVSFSTRAPVQLHCPAVSGRSALCAWEIHRWIRLSLLFLFLDKAVILVLILGPGFVEPHLPTPSEPWIPGGYAPPTRLMLVTSAHTSNKNSKKE